MPLSLRFHRTVQPALARWRRSLGATREERQWRFEFLIQEMCDRLEQYRGVPPEAVAERNVSPTCYWWQFTDHLLIKYVVRDDARPPRGWWDLARHIRDWVRKPNRTVVITDLILGNRPRAVAAPLPR